MGSKKFDFLGANIFKFVERNSWKKNSVMLSFAINFRWYTKEISKKKKNANNCVFYGKLFEYKKFKAVLTIAYNTVKCKFWIMQQQSKCFCNMVRILWFIFLPNSIFDGLRIAVSHCSTTIDEI